MEGFCFNCREPANFTCSCRFPTTFVCERHKTDHENTPSALHDFKAYPVRASRDSKQILVQKLEQMIESNRSLQRDLNENAEKKFTEIFNLLNEIPERFKSLVDEKLDFLEKSLKELQNIQNTVESTDIICVKDFYTPLEKALIEPDFMRELVDLVSPAEVVFKTIRIDKVLSVVPSNISHIFSHYNYLANYNDGSIRFKSPGVENILKIELNLDESFRLLKVSPSSVLITGGEGREKLAHELDFQKSISNNAPILNLPRKFHAMAWIEGHPAVIGGSDGIVDLDSVEVLNGNKWEISREVLKNRRKLFVTTNHLDQVFIAGGGFNPEVYSRGTWDEIVLNSPLINGHFSMFYSSDRLLLFGGKKPACVLLNLLDKTAVLGSLDDDQVETEKSGNDFYFKNGLLQLIHKTKDLIMGCKMNLS